VIPVNVQQTDFSLTSTSERLLREILIAACDANETRTYLQAQTPTLRVALGADFVGLLSIDPKRHTCGWISESGHADDKHQHRWASLADRSEPWINGSWCALPIPVDRPAVVWLVARFPQPLPTTAVLDTMREVAETLAAAVGFVSQRERIAEELKKQETLLRITQRWSQVRQLRPLLTEIAQTAAEFLHADRATIFLWDRQARLLIGRPALGVEDELRIPDDAGIAGRVLNTGRPMRVARESPEQRAIDRRVDSQLGYHTENLLCVPLKTRAGRILGVFEVMNKKNGEFTEEDEESLLDLAEQAAAALESVRDYEQVLLTRRQIVDEMAGRIQLVGRSPGILRLRREIDRLAETDLPVLILGENGTGKEVVAQLIHYLGERREHPFIAVNCAAIPESLAESELFGHEKGAFTDAHESRPGKFELAHNGTIFLDEVAELSPAAQAKLLRVLEEKMVTRVGGTRLIPVHARVIAATNRDLHQWVKEGRFREDLFYRLNTVTLQIPALRDRGEDIILLAEHFLREFSAKARRPVPELSPEAKQFLLQYSWPGNVRELRNAMERIAYLCPHSQIEVADLGLTGELRREVMPLQGIAPGLKLREATKQFQIAYIRRTIESTQNNVTLAARQLGLHRANLYRKMRQLGIRVPRGEQQGDEDPDTG